MRRQEEDEQSRVLSELCTLILKLLHGAVSSSNRQLSQSPAGLASFLVGVSLSLMLCGSLTFFIGFMLIPLAVCFFLVLYVVGIVSTFSILGSAICSHISPPPTATKVDVPGKTCPYIYI